MRKDYGRGEACVRAVDEVDLDVAPGESVAVVGPSGCGKSTLLYLLGGLERPTAGTLWLEGEQLDRMPEARLARLRRHAVGFVFQAFHLVEELTALRTSSCRRCSPANHRAQRAIAPRSCSSRSGCLTVPAICRPSSPGGQRQRVGIARALANEPTLVLADEPTGNLDSAATTEVLRLFEQLHVNGQTLVVVTHDERIAATADRLISMRDGAFVDETRHERRHGKALGSSPGWRDDRGGPPVLVLAAGRRGRETPAAAIVAAAGRDDRRRRARR